MVVNTNHWTERVIEQIKEPQKIPVANLKLPDGDGGFLEYIEAKALSGNEYFVLRSHPRIKEQKDEEGKQHMLALLVTYQRLHKADDGLKEDAFFKLPLHIQLKLVKALDEHFGMTDLARPSSLEKN